MNAFDAERARLQNALERATSTMPGSATVPKCNNLPVVKVGLVGCGYWGPKLARQFQQLGDAQLAALCDLCPDRLVRMGQVHPQAWLTQNFEDLLAAEIDAIAIATPARSHYDLARQALEAGKHVLVEKPLTATLAEAKALTELAHQHNQVLMVGHTFEYSPAVETARNIVASGELGPIQYIDSVRVNLGLLRPDVNVIWDLAIHDISILNYILGESALQVSTRGKACTLPELGLHDVATLILQYPHKLLATVRVSWLEPIKRRTLTIVGRNKTLLYDETAEFAISLYDSAVEVETISRFREEPLGDALSLLESKPSARPSSKPVMPAADWPVNYRRGNKQSYALSPAEPLTQLSQHFLDCIARHRLGQPHTPRSSAQVGLAAVQVLEAAQQSLEADGAMVDVKTQKFVTAAEPEPDAAIALDYDEPQPPMSDNSAALTATAPLAAASFTQTSPASDPTHHVNSLVGIVVVGRNEGDRLHRSLTSTLAEGRTVVYVDSGSTDNSVALAKSLGVDVVELDPNYAFTAARAYNSGVERLLALAPNVEFVQFLDGDCTLVSGWIDRAFATAARDSAIAVICGRRREEFRTRNVFHRLIDMEWNTRIGELTECGAEGLMRLSLFNQVGGFDESLIAGEEPELCLRLRRAGGKVIRIDADVSLHDVQMSQVSQWWKRTLRNGYSMAENAWRYGTESERFCLKQSLSIWFWALVMPGLAIAIALPTQGFSLLTLLLLYGFQAYRVARYRNLAHGDATADAWLYGFFCILGKVPELQGQVEFWLRLALGRRRGLVEYKQPG